MAKMISLKRPNAELVGVTTGKGADVLLLHAGGESRKVWSPVMSTLTKKGFRSFAFDQRGHGESGGSTHDGIMSFGDDAKAMIEQTNRPVVVGGSLGGFALMLALKDLQAKVAGLILVDVTPAPNPERTQAYLSPRGDLGSSPLVADILSRADQFNKIVSDLKLPILLVCGGEKSPLDEEARVSFAALAPHATIKTIEKAGHLVARDEPEKLSKHIYNFMQRRDVRTRHHY